MRIDVQATIASGIEAIKSLPSVVDYALIGSAMYLPEEANDVDFAVLIDPSLSAVDYSIRMHQDDWGNCGEYDGVGGIWAAVRREHLNFMITHDKAFFDKYKTAMEVCKALHLTRKQDRIAVCQIVRDGRKADEVAKFLTQPTQTAAARDVLAERQRQIDAEGWTPEHDDEHDPGELSAAASSYAIAASDEIHPYSLGDGGYKTKSPEMWPWAESWWKPGADPRRMLVKAGALILAEIERLDRDAPSQPAQGDA